MLDLAGKTAVISGGAAGIGFGLARLLGQRGMRVVIADIEAAALADAEQQLRDLGVSVLAIEMDVSIRDDWQRTAEKVRAEWGDVHVLVNNAGVGGGFGALGNIDDTGWRWAIDVNLMGVVYGADAFVPSMLAHGEPGWLINVASMAGMAGVPMAGSYTATKAAVVALTESWAGEYAGTNLAVSVLAPAFVKTRIHQSHRNRQPRYAPTHAPGPEVMAIAKGTAASVENGIDVAVLADRVLEAMEAGEVYIFTHPRYRSVTDFRYQAVTAAFERAACSPVVKDVNEDPNSAGFVAD